MMKTCRHIILDSKKDQSFLKTEVSTKKVTSKLTFERYLLYEQKFIKQ